MVLAHGVPALVGAGHRFGGGVLGQLHVVQRQGQSATDAVVIAAVEGLEVWVSLSSEVRDQDFVCRRSVVWRSAVCGFIHCYLNAWSLWSVPPLRRK